MSKRKRKVKSEIKVMIIILLYDKHAHKGNAVVHVKLVIPL